MNIPVTDMSNLMVFVGKFLRTKRPESIEPSTKLEVCYIFVTIIRLENFKLNNVKFNSNKLTTNN